MGKETLNQRMLIAILPSPSVSRMSTVLVVFTLRSKGNKVTCHGIEKLNFILKSAGYTKVQNKFAFYTIQIESK